VDSSFSLWIGGLLFSLPLLAVKLGMGLERGGFRRKQVLLIYAMYLAMFIGGSGWMSLFAGTVERIMKAGPYLHGLVGTTMIGWSIVAMCCLVSSREPSRASRETCLLALPCPAYFVAMIVSLKLARELTHLPGPVAGALLGIGFVSLGWLSQLLLGEAWARPLAHRSQMAMTLSLFVMGTYFVAATFLPGVMRDAGQVYASFTADGAEVGSGHGPWVWLMLAAVGALGYFVRGRSEMRS
jgi:predicted transporter